MNTQIIINELANRIANLEVEKAQVVAQLADAKNQLESVNTELKQIKNQEGDK